MKTLKIILLVVITVSITLWFSYSSIQRYLDRSGLKDIANKFDNNFIPGSPEKLKNYIDTFNLYEDSKPLETQNIKITKFRNKKILNIIGHDIDAKLLSFPSCIKLPQKQDSARFFIFKYPNSKTKKAILWIPGKGVSNFAFRFIKSIFYTELKHGYTILLYIPPYHMLRKTENSPETFFTPNILHNLELYKECIRELRTGIQYLNNNNFKEISGWGGSMGASWLCNLTNIEKFEHINLMIPIIDWKTVVYSNKYTKKVIKKYKEVGFSDTLIKKAYNLISPINYPIGLNPENVQIQYAKYDQLTPEKATLNFAKKNKIQKIIGYKKSHATILLSGKLDDDYEKFLNMLDK